jgi:hypothetical protein
VAIVGQRGDGDVGDVVGVDERLATFPAGNASSRGAPTRRESLTEVLAEDARRTIVQSTPDALLALARRASSFRPESRTRRRTPRSTARR